MGTNSEQKPVVLLQKKLTGEIVFDEREEHAQFLHDKILGIKTPVITPPQRPRVPRGRASTGRFSVGGGFGPQPQKVIISPTIPRQTVMPQIQIIGRNQPLRVLTGIKRKISEISSISIDGELDKYTPEQIERIISGYGPGMGGKKK